MKNTIQLTYKNIIVEVVNLTFATLIIAMAVFFFLIPSHTAVSSISGAAIVIHNFLPFSIAEITMALNIFLLLIGFMTCGNEFGAKTVYTSILLPIFLGIFETIYPDFQTFTGSAELDVVCYIFTVSIGLAILFNRNASSGGLDILAKIMNKYLRIDLGRSMTFLGMAVAFSSAFAYDTKTVVLSVLGSYLNGVVLDHFIFDQSLKRRVCIVSSKIDEIREFVLDSLGSGATIYQAIGAYKLEARKEIIVIVDKMEYQKLMIYMEQTDPHAFITIYKVSEMHYRPKIRS